MAITLPGDGTKVATTANTSSEHLQHLLIGRSDSPDNLVTANASGVTVQLGAAIPAGTNNIGDVDVLSLPALPTGSNAIGKLAANSGVDIGDVDITSVVPGYGASNLGKREDDAHATQDVGIQVLAVRKDTEAVSSGTTGDYEPFQTDSTGNIRVNAAVRAGDGTHLTLSPPIAIPATPSIDASAYAQNDNLDGDIISFANAVATSGGVGFLAGVEVQDKDDEAPDLSIFFLRDSITPEAQNAAFTMTDSDAENIVAVVKTTDGAWYDYVQGQKCFIPLSPPLPIRCAATTLYAVVRVDDASGYTPGSTSDLIITPTIIR